MPDRFDVGDVAELRTPFYVQGAGGEPELADPGTVTLTVSTPSGETITPTVVREELGLYAASFTLEEAGIYGYTWTGTDPAPGSASGILEVYGRLTRDAGYLEAYARLRALTEAETEPLLEPLELEELLRANQIADSLGNPPGADGYIGTFAVNRAVAEGWRRKAAKLVGKTDVNADDGAVKRSQEYKHALEMARLYSRMGLHVAHLTAARIDTGADRGIVNLSEARLEELQPGSGAGGGPV